MPPALPHNDQTPHNRADATYTPVVAGTGFPRFSRPMPPGNVDTSSLPCTYYKQESFGINSRENIFHDTKVQFWIKNPMKEPAPNQPLFVNNGIRHIFTL
jgi:hypothetical protein